MWSTNSLKIAATFAGLGFRVVIDETVIIELDSWRNLRFEVSDTSITNPQLPHRDHLYRGWRENTLIQLDNDHPFLCGMFACHNMECLMNFQAQGTAHALRLVTGSPLYRYELGQEDPRLKLAELKHATVDLPLAAAVGLIGLPVTALDGTPPRRRYLFPDLAKGGQTSVSAEVGNAGALPSISQLFARITPGKPNLQLGLTHPQHPVIHGYNATYAYARLQSEVKQIKKRLLLKDPYSDRRALITETPTPALEDEVARHFRVK